MSSYSELTEQHLEMNDLMADLRDQLRAAQQSRVQDSLEALGSALYSMAQVCMSLKRMLARQHYVIDAHLVARAARILGGHLEEADALGATFDHLMDALDDLLEELPGFPEALDTFHVSRLVYTWMLCDEIDILFERHMSALRGFYQSYATLLFPGGAVAE